MRILIEATMPLNIWTTMGKKYADLRGINMKNTLNWGLSHIAAQSVFENSENRLSSVSICCIMTLAPSSALESYNCTQNVYKSTNAVWIFSLNSDERFFFSIILFHGHGLWKVKLYRTRSEMQKQMEPEVYDVVLNLDASIFSLVSVFVATYWALGNTEAVFLLPAAPIAVPSVCIDSAIEFRTLSFVFTHTESACSSKRIDVTFSQNKRSVVALFTLFNLNCCEHSSHELATSSNFEVFSFYLSLWSVWILRFGLEFYNVKSCSISIAFEYVGTSLETRHKWYFDYIPAKIVVSLHLL